MMGRFRRAVVRLLASVLMMAWLIPHKGLAWPPEYDDTDPPGETIFELVIITASAHNGEWTIFDWGGAGGVYYMDQIASEELVWFFSDPRKDVRCHPDPDVRAVTSHHDVIGRYLAAEAQIRYYMLSASLNTLQRLALNGRPFTVTYADGATESWLVINPAPTMGGPMLRDTPNPGMVPGNGVAQPGSGCPAG